MNDVRWHYSSVDEDRLIRHFDVTPVRDTIALEEINWDASLKNQNRAESHIDADHARDIATAMTGGDLIDATIVRRNGRGLYFLDGNHRGKAAESVGEIDLDVWFVECSDDTADMIAQVANIGRHGKGVSDQHRMDIALRLAGEGRTPEIVCTMLGITRSMFDAYKVRTRAARKVGRVFGSSVKPPNRSVSPSINRLEDEELKILGPDLLKATATQVDGWSARIAAEKPKDREPMAHQVRGEMIETLKATAKARTTSMTEARRGASILAKNLRRAMDEAPKKDSDKLYDQVHSIYLTAQSARAGDV